MRILYLFLKIIAKYYIISFNLTILAYDSPSLRKRHTLSPSLHLSNNLLVCLIHFVDVDVGEVDLGGAFGGVT